MFPALWLMILESVDIAKMKKRKWMSILKPTYLTEVKAVIVVNRIVICFVDFFVVETTWSYQVYHSKRHS